MKSLAAFCIMIFTLFTIPLIALAQTPIPVATPGVVAPVDPNSAVTMLGSLLTFWKNGQYLLAGSIFTLIFCFIIKQYVLPKIGLGSAVVPILSTVVGILSGLGLAVANGASPIAAAIAVMSGPLSTHAWEGLVSYFFPKAMPAPTAAVVKKS